jgi:hypothetical protein
VVFVLDNDVLGHSVPSGNLRPRSGAPALGKDGNISSIPADFP